MRLRGDDGEFTFHLTAAGSCCSSGIPPGVTCFSSPGRTLCSGWARVATTRETSTSWTTTVDNRSIHLDGGSGDIVLKNADCAEEFDCGDRRRRRRGRSLRCARTVARASVNARTTPESRASFPGSGYRPVIVLGAAGRHARRAARGVALTGRVACRVDATQRPVRVGDLLAASSRPGHAMAAEAGARAVDSVVGKAMGSLPAGTGLVPMLVMLR